MFFFVMLVGLIFLVAGGVGLFYTLVQLNLVAGDPLWVFGLIIFITFAVFGLALLVFLALFNTEFD